MYGPDGKQLLFMAALCGLVGWAIIEGVLFVVRHLSIEWIWP